MADENYAEAEDRNQGYSGDDGIFDLARRKALLGPRIRYLCRPLVRIFFLFDGPRDGCHRLRDKRF